MSPHLTNAINTRNTDDNLRSVADELRYMTREHLRHLGDVEKLRGEIARLRRQLQHAEGEVTDDLREVALVAEDNGFGSEALGRAMNLPAWSVSRLNDVEPY